MTDQKRKRTASDAESGIILPIVIVIMVATMIIGLAFVNAGVMENDLASREVHKTKAFYVAEAGLERTLWNLKEDFDNGSGDWTDGKINGIDVLGEYVEEDGAGPGTWGLLQYNDPAVGDGSFQVQLHCVDEDKMWVRSTGTVRGVSKNIQVYMKMENLSPWNNAIFAGAGATGNVINGNVRIRGSVLILGENLNDTDLAMDLSGEAGIGNNYQEMPTDLAARIPSCPQTPFNGEMVKSMDAKVRVKQGKVGLSGEATVGYPDLSGNNVKETVDGVYVNDGYGGNQGAGNVYSDNGATHHYTLGNMFTFPSLTKESYTDPVSGFIYSTYLDYLKANALCIPGTTISEISSDVESFSSGNFEMNENGIAWDQSTNELHVNGIVVIEADSLSIGKKKETIEYTGKGTIVVAQHDGQGGVKGSIHVRGNLVARGTYAGGEGFPRHVLGLITGSMYLATGPGESELTMMGAFYAENKIVSAKQNEVAGTFFSNYFDMGKNVPRIYQVPALAYNLPPGMIASAPVWYMTTSQWKEV